MNHAHLHVRGMSQQTTSPGEAMHYSMKSGFDKVYSSMSLEVSASTMMNKAERKGKKIASMNAAQVQNNNLWSKLDTRNYLTNYCETLACEQWDLSSNCKVIRESVDNFLVFTLCSTGSERPYKMPIPSFFRIRKVCTTQNGYMSCSCGLPSRNKYPCRHIMAVVGKVHWKMYGVRWLVHYNHAFERVGKEDLSKIFRHMETKEHKCDVQKGEQVWVEGLLQNLSRFPIATDFLTGEERSDTTTGK